MLPDELTKISKRGVPLLLDPAGVRRRRARLPAVPELAVAGRAGHLGDGDHVRVRAGLADRAAPTGTPTARGPTGCRTRRSCPRSAFVSANLIIYWSGFEATWKILAAIFLGRVVFEIALHRSGDVRREDIDWRAASWIWPWLIGLTLIGLLGRYGNGAEILLPDWIDLGVVIIFSLVIFYYAVGLAMSPDAVHDAIETEEQQIASAPKIVTA